MTSRAVDLSEASERVAAAGTVHTRIPAGRVWRAGGLAAAAGAVALYAYGAAASGLGVPMRAGDPGAAAAQPVTPGNFAVGTVFCTILGTVLAVLLARYAVRPARTFVRIAVALVAVSELFPLAASHTAMTTRLTLAVGHLVAAGLVIPTLTRTLNR